MESEMADAPTAAAIPSSAVAGEPLAAVAEEGEAGGEAAEAVGSTLTMERVAAAKKFIENHYRSQMKNIQERKERYLPVRPAPIPISPRTHLLWRSGLGHGAPILRAAWLTCARLG
jgi:hypothetical protein